MCSIRYFAQLAKKSCASRPMQFRDNSDFFRSSLTTPRDHFSSTMYRTHARAPKDQVIRVDNNVLCTCYLRNRRRKRLHNICIQIVHRPGQTINHFNIRTHRMRERERWFERPTHVHARCTHGRVTVVWRKSPRHFCA